jgi:uncharacterized protein (TIGR03067 family)
MTPLLLLSVTLAAPVPKAPEKAEAKFDGVWVLTAREYRGREMTNSPSIKESHTLVIVGNDYVFKTHGGTIKFDKEKKTFEVNVAAGSYKGESSGGVFERDGDTLRLAMPSIPRTATAKPTELGSGPNATHYLYTFERDKDAKAEKVAEQLKTRTAALPNRANPLVPIRPLPLPLPVPAPAPVPAIPAPAVPAPAAPAQQLKEALDRIEKLEKRIQELEKALTKDKK